MSKLSFRARALDATKPMPIYLSEELPDLPEYLSINRAVPQMPSGMEKEEESERHLQEAISAGKVIPTPEVFGLDQLGEGDRLDLLYPHNNKVPKQYIHYQSYAFDNDVAEYDMDSEDEKWINAQVKKMDIPVTYDQFEEMMDRLEKGSGQQVITLKEAKLLLKEDDDLIVAVYDYWLNKRLRLQFPLIPAVKTEKTAGVGQTNNPYIAFRRRVEKMQTRKNRKNDETSYEKMLKLRRDLSRAVTILEMVKRREKMKKEQLHLTVEIFEKRHSVGDYNGQVLIDVSSHKASQLTEGVNASLAGGTGVAPAPPPPPPPPPLPPVPPVTSRPAYSSPLYLSQQKWATKVKIRTVQDELSQREKRSYKKRKHSRPLTVSAERPSTSSCLRGSDVVIDTVTSDEEESSLPPAAAIAFSEEEDDPEPDGEFTFHRKRNCSYLAPSLCERLEGHSAGLAPAGRQRRYSLGAFHRPRRRCLGLVRHRVGRGGRVLIDRICAGGEKDWRSQDLTMSSDVGISQGVKSRVERPSPCSSPELDVKDYIQNLPSGYHVDGVVLDGAASPLCRPLTVHMVASSSVRLVPTPDSPLPRAGASPPHNSLSTFSLTPSNTFSELVTNLISPYLVDDDGVLLTDAGGSADLEAESVGSWAAPSTTRPSDRPQQERGARLDSSDGAWPVPPGLAAWLGGGGGTVATTAAAKHVLLADIPPALQLMPDKSDDGRLTGSTVQPGSLGTNSSVSHSVRKLVPKSSGTMEVT